MQTENLDLNKIQITAETVVKEFGKTLIVAPHADDESLGCGGIIALMRRFGQDVFILLLSDGTLSHPNSKKYPSVKLRNLREKEILEAAEILGVSNENVIFCRYKDRNVPNKQSFDFDDNVIRISKILENIKPQSIFLPWRRDPHPDHRSAYQLVTNANAINAKIYEYPIWLGEIGNTEDAPRLEEINVLKIDISGVLDKKQKAISAHLSQTTDLIDDDPQGFMLSQEMLNHFKNPTETFFTAKI